MAKTLYDLVLQKTTALPAAAATANGGTIDLEQVLPDGLTDTFRVLLEIPATPALVDTKTITFTIKDSEDNSSFAAIPGLGTKVTTGAGGAGAAATSQEWRLPTSVRRYIRVEAAVESGGGNNTGVSFTVSLGF